MREVIGGTNGMAIGRPVVDPQSGSKSPALGQYFAVVLTLVFFAIDGHLQWIALIVEAIGTFPPARLGHGSQAPRIAGFGAQMLDCLAIALPVTLCCLRCRSSPRAQPLAPSLNLFALGLPAGIVAGLAALIISAPLATEHDDRCLR